MMVMMMTAMVKVEMRRAATVKEVQRRAATVKEVQRKAAAVTVTMTIEVPPYKFFKGLFLVMYHA